MAAIAETFDLDVHRALTDGLGAARAAGEDERHVVETLDDSALIADEVRVALLSLVAIRRGLEAPDVVAEVGAPAERHAREIEEVAVEGRAVPAVALQLVAHVGVGDRGGGVAQQPEDGDT